MQISGLQYGLPKNAMLPPYFSGADGTLRVAGKKELDIFGSSLPTYEIDSELYLGGEGMVATADGYADFVRMLLRRGELNGVRLLDEKTVEDMTSPQTQLDNEYGYNGYNIWINNGKFADGSAGRGGLWIGGGYEGTHFWVDPEYQFVGVIMTQIFSPSESGQGMQDRIREAVYQHINFDRERGRP
jgi:CubicO group peptidase (beta-lactamase class C family)